MGSHTAARGDRSAVRRELRFGTGIDDLVQPVVAERAPQRVEEVDREVVVVIREQLVREVGEHPHVRGAAPPRRRTGRAGHEPAGFERVEVLADAGFGQAERSGELTGRRVGALEALDDLALAVTEFGAPGIGLDGSHHAGDYRKYPFA